MSLALDCPKHKRYLARCRISLPDVQGTRCNTYVDKRPFVNGLLITQALIIAPASLTQHISDVLRPFFHPVIRTVYVITDVAQDDIRKLIEAFESLEMKISAFKARLGLGT